MSDTATLLERYADAKNHQDLDLTLACCSDEGFYAAPSLGLRVEGKPELARFYGELFRSLPDYYGEFEGRAVSGDIAAVWGHFGGTTSGEFMGRPCGCRAARPRPR